MKFILHVPLFATFVAAVSAVANFSQWMPPGPGDVRSPCPGMNSLANHGILPRNGKGITLPMLTTALLEGLNTGPDFSAAIGGAGLLSSPNALLGTFDLDNLDEHNFPIEHDASLSRSDFFETGDDHTFNQSIFDTVLAFFDGMPDATIPTAAKAKFNRVTTEQARDPGFIYGAREFVLSYGENALYLSVMGDPITGIAPVEFVKIFFEQERLPYDEGWRPPTTQTNLATLAAMAVELNMANGEPIPENLILDESTLKLAFEGLDPITGLLGSVTGD